MDVYLRKWKPQRKRISHVQIVNGLKESVRLRISIMDVVMIAIQNIMDTLGLTDYGDVFRNPLGAEVTDEED